MPKKSIQCSIGVTVDSVPTVSTVSPFLVDAIDMLAFDVPARSDGKDGDVTTDVQPSAPASVKVIVIESTLYHATDLTCQQTADESKVIKMDGPQIFIGSDVVELLGSDPTKLRFINKTPQPATISIFVGRDGVKP